MSRQERVDWDRRYAQGGYRPRQTPSPFFERWLPTVLGEMGTAGGASARGPAPGPASPAPGRALDLATGTGRHALRLAEAGFEVDALDISEVALAMAREKAAERGLRVNFVAADLDAIDLEREYDLITVFRYRNPALWPKLIEALAPNGWLLVEHHLRTSLPVDGPGDDAFLMRPGELLEAFASLRIVHYDEAVEPGDRPGANTTYVMVRFAACKGDPGW